MRNLEDIIAKIADKQKSKIGEMSPKEREDLGRLQEERFRRILEEAKRRDPELKGLNTAMDTIATISEIVANNDPAAVEASLEKILSETDPDLIERFLDNWSETEYRYLDEKDDDIAAVARDSATAEGRRQGVEAAANLPGIIRDMKEAAREGAKKAVETTLPKAYAKTANMSGDELREATKPKTHSYGGRKKGRDLDDAQVKAVLADMKKHKRKSFRAYCDYIIKTMKDGMYQNPHTTAKDLDAAVRRYCKKHGIPLVFKTRTGAWSAKS